MKILHVICTGGIAGAEKHLLHLLPGLQNDTVACSLLIICLPKALESFNTFRDKLVEKGVPTEIISTRNPVSISILKKVNRLVKDNDYDAVHSHLLKADVVVTLVKKIFNRKLFIISTKHGYEEKVIMKYGGDKFRTPKNRYYYFTAFTLKHINRNISVSHTISKIFVDFKLTKEYFPVIYHGVELPMVADVTKKYDPAHMKLVIVGRLEELKGHSYVLQAMPEIIQSLPGIKLLLIGNGGYKSTLVQAALSLGIEKEVEFLGFQHNPYLFIAEADIIIVPSMFEALGLVFLEAMGLKTPIVAFDVPAGNEILNNSNGCLVPAKNVTMLAGKIIDLMRNPQERERLAENAYQDYLDKFTKEKMVQQTLLFYKSIQSAITS